MTLDEMYNEISMYVDEAIIKVNGEYTGDSLKIINKFKSALNYAYKKICREKFKLEYFETLSSESPFTKDFYKLISLVQIGTNIDIDFEIKGDNIYYDYSGQVDIVYNYIPDDLVNLTDIPLLPESNVDHKILCYFAAFQYLNIEDDDRAVKWLNLWNDGFNSIRQPNKINRVKSVYDLGGYYD